MRHGHNIITDNLQAFCGGALGLFAICFKPILLDATGTASMGVLALIGIYALKIFVTAIISAVGGLATAWGADVYKDIKNRGKKNGDPPSEKSKDKAA
jgi:hypothetical protein